MIPAIQSCPADRTFGTAIIYLGRSTFGPLRIVGLSPGGALLQGVFPNMCVGSEVVAQLQLPCYEGQGIWLKSWVRSYEDDSICTVSFRHSGHYSEESLHDAVLAHRKAIGLPPSPAVVLLTNSSELRRRLRDDLILLDRDAIVFRTPLDAIFWMEAETVLFNTMVVDSEFDSGGLDLLGFLADRYPEKRRVLIRRDGNEPPVDASLSHAVLKLPWQRQELEVAIGVSTPKRSPDRRVLFVDDEPLVLASLQCRLRKAFRGCETVFATSGKAALAEFHARPFDVVVSDWRMPGIDGLALLSTIKRERPNVRRVVLTGYETDAAEKIADHVLRKPCPPELLREVVLAA